jgi:hypothetical protein
MTPGKLNFTCPQGSTFERTLTYKLDNDPVNIFGYSARLQVREFHYSKDFVLSLVDGNGITLGASAGTIDILVDSEDTTNIVPGNYVYDLELVAPNGSVSRLIEGKFIVTPEVTR